MVIPAISFVQIGASRIGRPECSADIRSEKRIQLGSSNLQIETVLTGRSMVLPQRSVTAGLLRNSE